MVDYNNDTFDEVEQLANSKGLALVCNYYYELTNDDKKVYWSYYLSDIVNFLKDYNA